MSSTSVMQCVLQNAERVQTEFDVDRVTRSIPRYVQTSNYTRALKILEAHKFIIISGVPGIGKTTLADMLLFAYLELSYEPIVIKSEIAEARKQGSERESVKGAILRDFLQAAKCDEFDIHHRNPLGLQQQIPQVLVAAATVDQHANIPIDGLDYAKANFGLAIVGNAVQVLRVWLSSWTNRHECAKTGCQILT
jgi:hypothetical protein